MRVNGVYKVANKGEMRVDVVNLEYMINVVERR